MGLEESYYEDTEAEFRATIKQSGVNDRVVPSIMTSEEAARGWDKPIRLFWINGDHRCQAAKLDLALWEPNWVEGGILAMHDTIRKNGPSACYGKNCFALAAFKSSPSSTTSPPCQRSDGHARGARLHSYLTLALRALYIAARKSGIVHSKSIGRLLLKGWTRRCWRPSVLLICFHAIAQ